MTDYTRTPPDQSWKKFAWSYSRWSNFNQCKAKYNMNVHRKAFGLPEYVQGYNAARGERIHKLGENFLLGKITGMPDELSKFQTEFKEARRQEYKPEEDWYITRDWELTKWDDWDNIWLRVTIDAQKLFAGNFTVIDYKTGKKWPEHFSQGDLYAWAGFMLFPEVNEVDVEFWYLDSGDQLEESYDYRDKKSLMEYWSKQAAIMEECKRFDFEPSKSACRFCEFSHKKGGVCREGV